MEIKEFLQQCEGRWFAQRTSYQVNQEKFENSKSEITVELLSSERPEVIELCQQHEIEPQHSLGGIRSSWEQSVAGGPQKGATVLVFVPDSDSKHQGKLLQSTQKSARSSQASELNSDDATFGGGSGADRLGTSSESQAAPLRGSRFEQARPDASVAIGHFLLGDEALTLTITDGAASFEERLWFASPNLRLRTSLFKQGDGLSTTCFYSEIRKLPPKSTSE